MKKIIFSILFICFWSNFIIAQTNVKIMDIGVTPALKMDTISGQPLNITGETLNIVFKIKNIGEANKVHVLFGTDQDIGDILTIIANVSENSSVYYLTYNGIQKQVTGYSAQIEVVLTSQQLNDYTYITLYVEDNSGLTTDRLYFVK